MSERELVYLEHILECINAIEQYARAVGSLEILLKSGLYEDAVMRRIHIMSESMLRLEEDSKKAMPEIPWTAIKNFRNLIVHQYLEVDMEIVWNLIVNDLPLLKEAIKRVLENKNV
jgi:uncharacterized protein with HEPN domain